MGKLLYSVLELGSGTEGQQSNRLTEGISNRLIS